MAAILSSPLHIIASTPIVTRVWTVSTLVFSAAYAALYFFDKSDYAPFLVLVPGSGLFYPWTLAISALVETSIFELIGTLIFVPASLRYLERIWGAVETIKFILATIVVSNIIAFGFNWIEFMGTKNAELFLYGMQYHGQMALQIGILVAFTQLIPEHQVQVMGVIKARVKSLPMAYLTISTVMTIIGFQCPWIIIQFGWFVSWVYLRFYKKNTTDAGVVSYGDRSETFALIYWFPPFIHYPLGMAANKVHSLASRFHLIPASGGGDLESGNYSQIPGGQRAEAERRRALALKALDQRMANSVSQSTSQTPSTSAPNPNAPRPPPAAVHAPPRTDHKLAPSASERESTSETESR